MLYLESTQGEWKSNLQFMLQRLEYIKKIPQEAEGVYLHMGCGPQIISGFVNIDKFYDHPDVKKCDMYKPPYEDESVDLIYSSHSLEHLPYRQAKLALINWSRILKQGKKLYLAIPDLEETMKILLMPDLPANYRDWYMYTLFGYQVDPGKYAQNPELDLPPDPGQFHTCGFTKTSIRELLEQSGMLVTQLFNYDGWQTPSIWVEAEKA